MRHFLRALQWRHGRYITLLRAYYQLCASAMRTMSPLAMGAELVVMT